jgi:hypothetical protein
MLTTKSIILSSSIFSSVYLFTTSLKEINKYLLSNNDQIYKYSKYFTILNGFTLILSTNLLLYTTINVINS